MNKQLFRFTLLLLMCLSIPSMAAAQVDISAVPSVVNPTVGDTIEISINIANGSNVGGYEFRLTFNPTQLQYISIENADYLPAGAFVTAPEVSASSVKLTAVALTGAGDGDGTLAVATFKVLAATATTVGIEDVLIADPAGQTLVIASITDATINPTTSTTETQVTPPTVPDTTTPVVGDTTASSTTSGQVVISAVPSVVNPAVGDTIEISINIANGSNIGGYEFRLTFNSTQLQYISIENADYLPAGAFVTAPEVTAGSVKLTAVAVTGPGEGDGTLAVATFKVLVATETTVGVEDVLIADPAAQTLAIASITDATINPATSTTETQVTPPTVPDTTTPVVDDTTVSSTTAGQVVISAVPSVVNPAVGNTIEISINITNGSNVGGYEFRLTFNPAQLQYISIENADYLPAGAFVTAPEVTASSVKLTAVAVTGPGEGDGTLAVATFKVLVATETTVGVEDVLIADPAAQTLTIASITDATINRAAPTADAEVEYLLSMPAGINLIHVPLKVTAVDGIARTIGSIADLYDALGGASTVNFLITYNSQVQEWRSFFVPSDKGTSADRRLTDDIGIIAGMKTPVSVRLRGSPLGTNGNSSITLKPGLNVVGLPLRDSRVMRVSDLFALNGIGGNVPVIILTDDGEFKSVGRADDPGDIQITGGQAFIMTAQRAATVTISGAGWNNTAAAAPPLMTAGIQMAGTSPVLALNGTIVDEVGHIKNGSIRVSLKNLSTSNIVTGVIENAGSVSSQVGYRLTVVDIKKGQAASIGDILEISAVSSDTSVAIQPLRYTVTAENVKHSRIELPALFLQEIPVKTELLRNYPNPFNPETWIPYRLAEDAFVTLTIYDGSGQLVRTLDLGHQTAAVYESRSKAAYWDGRNNLGESVASGAYFYTLTAGDFSATRKMLILK